MFLSHRALATPVAGRVQCTLTWSPGVWCFLRHIGMTGFWLGWVVFRRMHASPESVRELQGWDKTVTTNLGGKKSFFFFLKKKYFSKQRHATTEDKHRYNYILKKYWPQCSQSWIPQSLSLLHSVGEVHQNVCSSVPELFLSIDILYVSYFVWTPGRVAAAFATAYGDPNKVPKYQIRNFLHHRSLVS